MPCEHVMLNCGKCTAERDQLREQVAAANAEIERLRGDVDDWKRSCADRDERAVALVNQRNAMTRARDEAAYIARRTGALTDTDEQDLAEVCKVGS